MNTTQDLVVREESTTTAQRLPVVGQSSTVPSFPERAEASSVSVRRTRAAFLRRLVHALAESGRPSHPSDLRLLVGPTGGPIWTPDSRPSHDDSWPCHQDGAR